MTKDAMSDQADRLMAIDVERRVKNSLDRTVYRHEGAHRRASNSIDRLIYSLKDLKVDSLSIRSINQQADGLMQIKVEDHIK